MKMKEEVPFTQQNSLNSDLIRHWSEIQIGEKLVFIDLFVLKLNFHRNQHLHKAECTHTHTYTLL